MTTVKGFMVQAPGDFITKIAVLANFLEDCFGYFFLNWAIYFKSSAVSGQSMPHMSMGFSVD